MARHLIGLRQPNFRKQSFRGKQIKTGREGLSLSAFSLLVVFPNRHLAESIDSRS